MTDLTAGIRKRFSQRFQLEANYVLSNDKDDDSNERDPFTDRGFLTLTMVTRHSQSDRDIRHKFNFFAYFELRGNFSSRRASRREEHSRRLRGDHSSGREPQYAA
jgi:hypothetical protein